MITLWCSCCGEKLEVDKETEIVICHKCHARIDLAAYVDKNDPMEKEEASYLKTEEKKISKSSKNKEKKFFSKKTKLIAGISLFVVALTLFVWGGFFSSKRLLIKGDKETGKCGYVYGYSGFCVSSGDIYGHDFVIEARFDDGRPFSEGVAAVKVDDKWGYINESGQMIIPPSFDRVWDFVNGYARVAIGSGKDYYSFEGDWWYIDKKGEPISSLRFDDARDFSGGLAAVKIDYKWGFINGKGELISSLRFDDTKDFSGGLAAVEIDSKWGYINEKGELVIAPQFDSAGVFGEKETAPICLGKKKGQIYKNGYIIWND